MCLWFKTFILVIMTLSSLIIINQPVFAETYNIEIIEADNATKKSNAICKDNSEICFLTLETKSLNNNQKNYIDIAFKIDKETAHFEFMQNREYLFTSSTGKKYFEVSLEDKDNINKVIKLYLPNPLTVTDQIDSLQQSAVLRTSDTIITTLMLSMSPMSQNE